MCVPSSSVRARLFVDIHKRVQYVVYDSNANRSESSKGRFLWEKLAFPTELAGHTVTSVPTSTS